MTGDVIMFPGKEEGVRKVSALYRNLAAALMMMQSIQQGNTLINVLGRGDEYSNQRAIES
ncbi:MAG: hypothetical protein AB2806_12440 [Candidatus Thiodiazotropha sp.]